MGRNRLYGFLALLCFGGYAWLGYSFQTSTFSSEHDFSLCMIKYATGIPCPSCGSTRSLMMLLKGEFHEALYWNPLGLLFLPFLMVCPVWISSDLIRKSDSLHLAFQRSERFMSKKWIAIPAVSLVLFNWIWNIFKQL